MGMEFIEDYPSKSVKNRNSNKYAAVFATLRGFITSYADKFEWNFMAFKIIQSGLVFSLIAIMFKSM